MYQMLRHSVPEALTFMIYQETHATTMTCGSKFFILLQRATLLYVLTISGLGLSWFKLKKIFFGGEPPLNTTLLFLLTVPTTWARLLLSENR